MNFSLLFLFGILIHLSNQTFIWSDSSKPDKVKNAGATGNRFVVNVVEYNIVNGTKSLNKFRCIGSLISEEFVLTTASCAKTPIGTHIGVQFETAKDDTNEVGHSITFDDTIVYAHQDYNSKDNEKNNIALIKFNPLTISTTPPLFSIFKPRNIGSIPRIAEYCIIIGRDIQLSSPPSDKVFVIGPGSCYNENDKQAYCTILDDEKADVCKVIQGAPVICNNNDVSGIVLREARSCINVGNGKYQLRYHSVGEFKKFIDYYRTGPTTVAPNSAMSTKLSITVIMLMLLSYINL